MTDIRSGDFININLSDWGMSKCFKKYCYEKLPQINNKNYEQNINAQELGKDCLCIPLYSNNIAYVKYVSQLGTYLIYDRNNIFIDKIVVNENDCIIIAQAHQGICYIFDIHMYKGIDISQLNYNQRYEYLNKLVISGMASEIIKPIAISQIVDYVNYYSILKNTKIILFYANNKDPVIYNIKWYDIRLPKTQKVCKFLAKLDCNKKHCINLYLYDKYRNVKKYVHIFDKKYSDLLIQNTSTYNVHQNFVLLCQFTNKWIPVSLLSESTTIDSILF